MEVIELEGEDKRLYDLVARLVMNPQVLRYNQNYPFRTSQEYRWFVATEAGETIGFLPVKLVDGKAVLNNYYVCGDDRNVFSALLAGAVQGLAKDFFLEAVVQSSHVGFFEKSGFSVAHYWKRFAKMIYRKE